MEGLLSELIVVTVLSVTSTVDGNFLTDDTLSSRGDEVIIVFSVKSSVIVNESAIVIQSNLLFAVNVHDY